MGGERVMRPVIEVDEVRYGPDDPAPNSFEPEEARSWRVVMVEVDPVTGLPVKAV